MKVFSSGLIGVAQSPYLVHEGSCMLAAAHLITDGLNDATMTVYDSAGGAEGTVLAKYKAKGDEYQIGEGNIKAVAHHGLVVELSGAGATALVRFAPLSPGR